MKKTNNATKEISKMAKYAGYCHEIGGAVIMSRNQLIKFGGDMAIGGVIAGGIATAVVSGVVGLVKGHKRNKEMKELREAVQESENAIEALKAKYGVNEEA